MSQRTQLREADLLDTHSQVMIPNYAPEHMFVRGRGLQLWDIHGKRYLDFGAGVATNTLGHCPLPVQDALRAQSRKLIHVSNLYHTEPQIELAQKLLTHSKLNGKVLFCNSGAEANEALIKLARLWGSPQGRHEIITFKQSFHGRTLATLTATGQDKVKTGFAPLPEGFCYAELNDIASVQACINQRTAAVLIEPIQGEGGVRPAQRSFLEELRALCDDHNILLLCDEVQTGIGRTGRWFGHQHADIQPDAMALAKGLGNGFPIGAIVTNDTLANVFQPGTHGTTLGGNPLACSVALAVLNTIERKGLIAHADHMGDLLLDKLEKVAERFTFISEVRGRGLMIGMECTFPAQELTRIMARRGLITLPTSGNVIRLVPPLITSSAQVRQAVRIITRSCKEWQKQHPQEPSP